MHHGTYRDVTQRHRVADLVSGTLAGHNGIAIRQSARRNDVAVLTILVHQQGNMGAAVGIVFNTFYGSGNAILVALEIDNPVVPLVTATAVTNGNTSGVITAADRSLCLQ